MKNLRKTPNLDYIKNLVNPKRTAKLFLVLGIIISAMLMHSCDKSETKSSENVNSVELNMDYEEFKAYLVELEKQSGIDIPRNPALLKQIDKHQSSLRSCVADCEYDLEDCGLDCSAPEGYLDSISIGGCKVYFSFDLLRCEDENGELVYNQIVDFMWWPAAGCAHFGVNTAYDINYTGGSKTIHDQNNNTVTGFILNHIEENIIYSLLATEGATALFGNIVSVVTKECYAYCDADELYKVCGEGCCMRYTYFEVDEGYVGSEETANYSNASLGHCTSTISFSCGTFATCDDDLDCEIETFN
jgi:hypothetical protein